MAVTSDAQSPDLDVRYHVFLGSLPDGFNVIEGTIASNT